MQWRRVSYAARGGTHAEKERLLSAVFKGALASDK